MGWLGDLWDSAKQKATGLYNSVKETASNWLSGKYLAPGGYRYCGPGNPIDNGDPINPSDALCRQHDMDYERFANMRSDGADKDELKRLIRESDDRLVSGLQQATNRDMGSRLAEYGIRTKKKLEDWGLLDHEKFVT